MRVVRPILVAFSASAVAALVPLSGVASTWRSRRIEWRRAMEILKSATIPLSRLQK
jgi:hypothetical protein